MNKELSMDLDKLENLAKLVLKDLSSESHYSTFSVYPQSAAKFKNLMVIAQETLPEYSELFSAAHSRTYDFESYEACSLIKHLLQIIKLEKTSETKIEETKIFESAEEKLKQSDISFRKEDYVSAFHNLNTALELVLKDKLGIPATITGVNTSNIMDVLTKYKVEPYLYLEEARRHVLVIDNKIKHQGYKPSKIDCINGIKAMEELIAKLKTLHMKLSEEVKNKIYEGL
jgi:HEPN domain-containing protein